MIIILVVQVLSLNYQHNKKKFAGMPLMTTPTLPCVHAAVQDLLQTFYVSLVARTLIRPSDASNIKKRGGKKKDI